MLKKLWNTIVAHQEARAKQIMKFHSSYKALSQLSAMSDKELRDIGIKRGDIPHVAFGNYEQWQRTLTDNQQRFLAGAL
jgi:uncharacterized protein YjiS (DUF1127 family)